MYSDVKTRALKSNRVYPCWAGLCVNGFSYEYVNYGFKSCYKFYIIPCLELKGLPRKRDGSSLTRLRTGEGFCSWCRTIIVSRKRTLEMSSPALLFDRSLSTSRCVSEWSLERGMGSRVKYPASRKQASAIKVYYWTYSFNINVVFYL